MKKGKIIPTGICKFCGQEKELINSHIIPKVFYRFKENPGGMVSVNVKDKRIEINPKEQNGLKEPLMCAECDGKIGKLDGYANKVLNGAVPKLPIIGHLEGYPCRILKSDKFDIDALHKFFISLLWRMSVASNPTPLGPYQEIALKILKDERPDDYNLFLPLIYRRVTGGGVDETAGVFRKRYLAKHTYIIRFFGWEIQVIVNTKNCKDKETMDIHKEAFNKDQVLIIDITKATPFDYRLGKQLFECRDNTPGLKKPKALTIAK